MRIWTNITGALLIAGIGFFVFKNISNNTRQPRPSNKQIEASLLAAVPRAYEAGKVDFLDKTIYVSASTTIVSEREDAGASIASNVTQSGWRKADTRLVGTAVFCKEPLVLKVIGPTPLAEDRYSYYLEASWGNYFSYCGRS